MTEDIASIRNRRDLVAARNLAQWSLIGVVIPLIGIIIAIFAKHRLNYVVETKSNWEEIDSIRSGCNISIVLSIVMFFVWGALFKFFTGY